MTSSVQPPVLNPPLGTPSSEWAKKTTSSFDPPSQGTPQKTTSEQASNQSPGVTPGNELPGAFPNRGQGEPSTGPTNITETIVDTAKQYFPTSVMNKVETLLGNSNSSGTTGTNQGVRASEHDIYHKASLPSQELRGALPHEHVGGVGSLPGASIEKSVALLPDEQPEWSEWNTFAGRNTPGDQTPSNFKENATGLGQTLTQKATNLGVAAGVVKADVPPKPRSEDVDKTDVPPRTESEDVGNGYPETLTSREIANAQQAVGNIKPVAFDIKQAHDVSIPSTETQGQQPGEHTDGVGSLPGPKDEQGVAVLPEERATDTTRTVRPEHREEQPGDLTDNTKDAGAMGVGVGGATDPLKKDTQSRGAQRSGHLGDSAIQLEPRVHPLGGDVSHWHGVNFGRRAMEEWECAAALTDDPPTEIEAVTPEQKTASSEPYQQPSTFHESDNLGGIQRSASSEGGAGVQYKPSLKEKIAGGMKVVTGKLGNDKSKVEEGKKLMHGQSA